MKKKTFTEFIEKYSSNKKLHRAIFKQGGVSFADFKSYPTDFYDPSTGAVTGLVYYSDTVKFGKKYEATILRELLLFNQQTGSNLMPPMQDDTAYYNWLTWFAWESMAIELINYLEQ